MPQIHAQPAVLSPHPSSPSEVVRAVRAQARIEDSDALVLDYSLDAELSRVRVPPADTGARADALWRHTCFEAFLAPVQGAGYHEFNFSPSGEWAVYRFGGYRNGMAPAKIDQAPQISTRRRDGRLELGATVRLGALVELRDARRIKVALAAVIEDEDGRLSYWALRHPPGKPDFHHATAFAMEVSRP